MRSATRSHAAGFGAIIALVSMLNGIFPANADSAKPVAPTIEASYLFKYARYYAPYAIQAATAYQPVAALEAARLAPAQPDAEADPDVVYAVRSISSDATLQAHAARAFRPWQYQFGSEGYLGCIDPADTECQGSLPPWFKLTLGSGPSFQVWARTHYPHAPNDFCTEISIAFRGTSQNADWFSNLEPVTQYGVDDYYHQLMRNMNAVVRKIAALDCYKRAKNKPQLVSVGHSLAGGLAQLAAFATKPGGPQITKVFAFDSSPITGANLVDGPTLNQNKRGLTIDRIYQRGEILAAVRAVAQHYPPSTKACNPLVRTVHVDAFSGNAVQLHSMQELAEHFVDLSYNDGQEFAYTPPIATACTNRYQTPPTDEDETPVARIGAPQFTDAGRDQASPQIMQRRRAYAYNARRGVHYAITSAGEPMRVRLTTSHKKILQTASNSLINDDWFMSLQR